MSSKILFIFLVGAMIPAYIEANCFPQLNGPGVRSSASPININSHKTILANVTTPMILFNGVFNFLKLVNKGNAIEAFPNEAVDTTFVTGGVLCSRIFKLHKIRFYVNNKNLNGRSGNAVNGNGAPLEALINYYDRKFGSFDEALKHPGGVTIISFRIKVAPGPPNIFFFPLQFLLSLGVIEKPGSTFLLPSPLVYIWFDVIQFIFQYFAYSGSYYQLDTGKQIPGINNIVTIPELAYISESQFKAAFGNVLGFDGKPIQAVAPVTQQGSTKVYRAFGFLQGLQFF